MLTKDKSFYRTFVGLALALMMQQAVVLSVNLADNVMLGSYSETALSGVAAVNQIQFILQQRRLCPAAGSPFYEPAQQPDRQSNQPSQSVCSAGQNPLLFLPLFCQLPFLFLAGFIQL